MLQAIQAETKLSKGESRKVLDFMLWKHGDQPIRKPIYASGLYRYTSFRRLSSARTIILESHFQTTYGKHDEKGRIFEDRCRDALRNSGMGVFPGRLIVPFQIVPSEISTELWGKVKKETDLDVLARAGHIGFIIECKEMKLKSQHLTSETNLFRKYLIELYYKTVWIAGNRMKFTDLLGKNDKLFEGVDFLIPLVVSTFPYNVDPWAVAQLTLSELTSIAKSVNSVKVEQEGELFYATLPWRGENVSVRTLALPFPN
jgi:hypothetical protein